MPSQDQLNEVFDELKKILAGYSPPFSVKKPSEALKDKRSYELVSNKQVEIDGRKKDEVYFAGLIIQKSYVGFYYMAAYADPKVRQELSPSFLSLLKGKSCFRIKSAERNILEQVKKALDVGLRMYKEKGWI